MTRGWRPERMKEEVAGMVAVVVVAAERTRETNSESYGNCGLRRSKVWISVAEQSDPGYILKVWPRTNTLYC